MKVKLVPKSQIKKGTRVLMRVDLNVPIKAGKLLPGANMRIERVLPDIKDLIKRGAKVIILSHLGRPGGHEILELSLKPVAKRLSRLLGLKVHFINEVAGDVVEKKINSMLGGEVIMLENLRFNPGEVKNSSAFAKKLARLGDLYINNAFSVSHRAHASMSSITKYLPSYAGNSVQEEVEELSKKIEKPFYLIIGGAKLKTKIHLINALAPKATAILLGGKISTAFCMAKLGVSCRGFHGQMDPADVKAANKLVKKFGDKIVIPLDYKYVNKKGEYMEGITKRLPSAAQTVDVGSKTIELYRRMLVSAKSIIWNGSMGVTENLRGRRGTLSLTEEMAELRGVRSVVGGGDTVSFLTANRLTDHFSYVSTGGGAMLAFLAGEKMPGLKRIIKK